MYHWFRVAVDGIEATFASEAISKREYAQVHLLGEKAPWGRELDKSESGRNRDILI